MITYEKSTDGEINMLRGSFLIGHVFSIGAPGKPLHLVVYTSDYELSTEVRSYDAAEAFILKQLQGD